MPEETIEEYLARGGKIKKVPMVATDLLPTESLYRKYFNYSSALLPNGCRWTPKAKGAG